MDDKVDWNEIPNVRKVGRYAFFAVCAFGVSVVAGVPLILCGASREIVHQAASLVGIVSFLALRDMSKQWDAALYARRAALTERTKPHVE